MVDLLDCHESRSKRSDTNGETVPERTVVYIYLFIYSSQEPKLVCQSFPLYGFHNYLLYIYGLGSPTNT